MVADGMTFLRKTRRNVLCLEPHVCSREKCAARKMCACVRTVRCLLYTPRSVQGSSHCLDAKLPERTIKSEKCASLRTESGFR